jgi:predicted DsbA family dithiol-disulfide isomerase
VSAVTIRYFTDPGCPYAFAAEPVRARLRWRFGEAIAWELRMSPVLEVKEAAWTEADLWRELHEHSGMPFSFRDRAWGNATVHACRAVVAAGLRWPDRQEAFLRRLRVLAMAGELLDDSDTLELAASQAGLPVADIAAYCAEPEVEAALRADIDGAEPSPTYEIAGCATLHGLPAIEAAEAALSELAARPDAQSVGDVLGWAAGVPLATAEIAAICGRDVRDELSRAGARFVPVGEDGYWS